MELPDLKSDDRRVALEAIRDVLADALAAAQPRDAAPLARQLRDTIQLLADLPAPKADIIDELKRKRDALRPNPSNPSAKGGKPRAGSGGTGGKRGTGT